MDESLKNRMELDLKRVETQFLKLKEQYELINQELFRLQGEQRSILKFLEADKEEKKEEPKKGGK